MQAAQSTLKQTRLGDGFRESKMELKQSYPPVAFCTNCVCRTESWLQFRDRVATIIETVSLASSNELFNRWCLPTGTVKCCQSQAVMTLLSTCFIEQGEYHAVPQKELYILRFISTINCIRSSKQHVLTLRS